jgi:hypothetical protein
MPLLIPITRPSLAPLDDLTRFYFPAFFTVTITGKLTDTLEASATITSEGEEAVFNAAVDVEGGDGVPVIIDLVNINLR